ncbi:nucleotidyltransferase domain protein, partial [Ancylostoma caninum]
YWNFPFSDTTTDTADVAGSADTAIVAGSADTAITVEQQGCKGNQPRSFICYEDFFITLKDFDPYSFKTKVDGLEKDYFKYSFDNADNFNNGYVGYSPFVSFSSSVLKPDMVCASCESSEHWSDACPMMTIPKIETISHTKQEYEWLELDHVILGTYEKNRMKEHRLEKLGEMVARIRSFLEKDLKRTVRLDIFGSLVNGLGAGGSDVDICFRFDSDEQPVNVDGVEIVREISTSLQKMKGLDKVYAITGAKVPIVKFLWPKFGFEGDISYYNVLALYNTQLLKTYCAWDQRVAPVGVWVKRWAKSCDIGDASRGSLSSYAIIILLIHYLQNCEPPVLPRLQEDFRNGDVKPILVENHDVYYHNTVFEKWSENRSSVSQLFVGFLDYYARFDFETQVVQIRRKKPLLKMEKDWSRSVCIEDPFDLNHNLGSGVTKKSTASFSVKSILLLFRSFVVRRP